MLTMKDHGRIQKRIRKFLDDLNLLTARGYELIEYTPDEIEKIAQKIRSYDRKLHGFDKWCVVKINGSKPSQYHGGRENITIDDIENIIKAENVNSGIIDIYLRPTAEIVKIKVASDEEVKSIGSEKIRVLRREKVSI